MPGVVTTTADPDDTGRPKPEGRSPGKQLRWQLLLLMAVAFAVRLILASGFPELPGLAAARLELNDPYHSWKSVAKTQWSLQPPSNAAVASPYSTSQFANVSILVSETIDAMVQAPTVSKPRPTPLIMMLLGSILPRNFSNMHVKVPVQEGTEFTIDLGVALYSLVDLVSIALLFQITNLRLMTPPLVERTTSNRIASRLQARHLLQQLGRYGLRLDPHPLAVGAMYAFNPLTIMTCLARSGTTLISCIVLLAVWAASEGYSALTGLGVAAASLTALHPLLLTPPLVLLCKHQKRYLRHHIGRRVGKQRKPDTSKDWTSTLFWTGVFSAGLAWLSAGFIAEAEGRGDIELKDWLVLIDVYKSFLTLPSLTPSLSLWWYFFIEIFDHFRDFFLLVFNAHLAMWTLPVTLRFRHDPLFAVFLLIGVQAIFKPYPTAGDVATWWALSLVFTSDYSPYLRNPLPPVLIYLYSTLLVPLFSHLFLTLGSANANFLYAVGLVWSLGGVGMWLDWAWAGGRTWWEREREAGLDEGRQDAVDGVVAGQKTSAQLRTVIQV